MSARNIDYADTWNRSKSPTVARAMVEMLRGMGIDTYFGVPGGSIIAVFDAVLSTPGATLIEPRHETYAAFEAMGAYRASGKTAAVLVTTGPGATNVITGIAAAHFERVPMIVISGDTAWERTGQRLTQSLGPEGIDFEEMVQSITRTTVRISRAEGALSQVRAAVRAARNRANPGPVLIVASIDQLDDAISLREPNSVRGPASDPERPPEVLVRHVADLLERAERPLIVLGAGCRPMPEAARELVDAVGVPFMTTPQAKGIISEEHGLSLRNGGMSASQWARAYTQAGPDVTLALATDLDDSSTAGTPPVRRGGTLIHVDTDQRVFGRNIPTQVAVAHDAGAFAHALAAEMRGRSPASVRRGAALAEEARRRSPFERADFMHDTSIPIAPHRVVADLQRAAGPYATFVTDIGEHMLFALHYLTVRGPDQFVIHLGLGSMASGIASSVGLALADRSRPVVCICGDGGMQMAGMEILLAIKHRLPIVYAVFNDARYNMVYHGHRLTYGHAADWDTPQIDFVKWAEAAGARGRRIERPGEITEEMLWGPMRDGVPLVLDVRQDRDTRIEEDGRISALIQMSRASRIVPEGQI